MAFVLDCSVTMAWVFPDEATESTDRLRESRQPSGSCSGNETADRSEERLRGPEAGTSGPRDVPGSGGSNIFGHPAGGPPLSSARRRRRIAPKENRGCCPGTGQGLPSMTRRAGPGPESPAARPARMVTRPPRSLRGRNDRSEKVGNRGQIFSIWRCIVVLFAEKSGKYGPILPLSQ